MRKFETLAQDQINERPKNQQDSLTYDRLICDYDGWPSLQL